MAAQSCSLPDACNAALSTPLAAAPMPQVAVFACKQMKLLKRLDQLNQRSPPPATLKGSPASFKSPTGKKLSLALSTSCFSMQLKVTDAQQVTHFAQAV